MPSTPTGGQLLAVLLANHGVEVVAGVIDASFTDLAAVFDEVGIRTVPPSTESAAVHMSAAWAHTTNRLGVAFVGGAAGLAHALPAMADAHERGDRVLVISASRRTGVTAPNRPGLVASLDAVAVAAPLVKWSSRVPDVTRIEEVLDAAMRAAWHGPPGVVHLDLPVSVLTEPIRLETLPALTRDVDAADPEDAAVDAAAADTPPPSTAAGDAGEASGGTADRGTGVGDPGGDADGDGGPQDPGDGNADVPGIGDGAGPDDEPTASTHAAGVRDAAIHPHPYVEGAAGMWRSSGPRATVADVAGRLVRAQWPVLHLGRGVVHSGADDLVRELVATLDAGVTTTWGGRGIVPEGDMHVIPPTHPGVVDDVRHDADVVLVLGADLGESDWWGQEPHWGPVGEQVVVQVDIDGTALGRNRPIDVGIVGDVATVLEDLVEEVRTLGRRDTTARRHWLGDHQSVVRRGRRQLDEPLAGDHHTPIHPAVAVAGTCAVMPPDTIWVMDGGHTRRWGRFHVPALRPRSILGDGRLELTGGGIGQALGARLAVPGRPVCALMGDGALARQLGELPTSIDQDLPIVIVVLVDGYALAAPDSGGLDRLLIRGPDDGPAMGAPAPGGREDARATARQVATRSLRDLSSGVRADPVRYDLVARALGAWGEFVDHPDQLAPALDRALAADRTAVVHVSIDRVEHTWTPEAGTFRAQRAPSELPRI